MRRSRLLKAIGVVLGLLLIAFVAFYFWAKSPTRSDTAYLTFRTYADPHPTPTLPDTFTVMAYNIGYLSGMTNNLAVENDPTLYAANLEHAVALIDAADPDLVAFQEIDYDAYRSQYVDQLDTLAQRLDYHAAAGAVNWDKRYVPFPYGMPGVHYQQIVSGQGIVSRYPMASHERIVLEKPPAPFYYNALYLDRLVQIVEVDLGRPVVVMNVHLEAFDAGTRQRQAEVVRDLFNEYAATQPVILLGDFNAPMPAEQHLAGTPPEDLDDTTLRLLAAEGIAEAFPDSLYQQINLGTFPADDPRTKIDHIFFSTEHFDVVDAAVVGDPNQPSDHRAIVARLVLR